MSIFRKIGRGLKAISRVPGVRSVARAVPFVGTAMAAYEGMRAIDKLTGGGVGDFLGGGSSSSPSVPALPSQASNLPMLRNLPSNVPVPGSVSGPGLLPRGPGGKLQLPWSDPNIPKYLQQFAIDDGYLKTSVRAPKGYVVLRDAAGRPFGVNKKIAVALRVWRPKKKPPISVTDWESLKRANRTVNKLKRVVKMSKVVSMPTTRRRTSAKTA